MDLLQLAVLGVLILVHMLAGKLRFIHYIPRSRWRSLAGGSSVAYVFIFVLPQLQQAQTALAADAQGLSWLAHHAYLVALFGMVVFYGLERVVKASQQRASQIADEKLDAGALPSSVFWLHIGSFAAYNALVGYLLQQREATTARSLLLFGLAMGLHFLVIDFGLQQDHRQIYRRIGRWVLAAAVAIGFAAGAFAHLGAAVTSGLFAFLAGSTILNVLKEELPAERQSQFWAFALGAAIYAALLLAV